MSAQTISSELLGLPEANQSYGAFKSFVDLLTFKLLGNPPVGPSSTGRISPFGRQYRINFYGVSVSPLARHHYPSILD